MTGSDWSCNRKKPLKTGPYQFGPVFSPIWILKDRSRFRSMSLGVVTYRSTTSLPSPQSDKTCREPPNTTRGPMTRNSHGPLRFVSSSCSCPIVLRHIVLSFPLFIHCFFVPPCLL